VTSHLFNILKVISVHRPVYLFIFNSNQKGNTKDDNRSQEICDTYCYLFKIRRYRRAGWNSCWHLPLYGGIQLPAAGGGGPRLQVPHTLYRKFITYIPRNETARPDRDKSGLVAIESL
jgi:hypothetical protein